MYNVAGGFEGPLDDDGSRCSVGGWKAPGCLGVRASGSYLPDAGDC